MKVGTLQKLTETTETETPDQVYFYLKGRFTARQKAHKRLRMSIKPSNCDKNGAFSCLKGLKTDA